MELTKIVNNSLSSKEILEKYEITPRELKDEYDDFILYWTEKNPNGKKERWQMEKVFDPSRRFHFWLRNNKKWSKKVLVNSDDEERKQKLEEIERKKKELFNKF